MIVYDDERRAVAENLRNEALHGRVGYLEQFRDRLADTLLIDCATYADIFDRLADLVEPGPERTCGMLVTETGEYAEYDCGEVVCLCRSCGREFVLVGLNEDGDAWCDVPSCCPFCEVKAVPANDGCRIREACGEGAESARR